MVGPWLTEAAVRKTEAGVSMRFTTPSGGDPTEHSRVDIAGDGRSFSALVHAIPEIGVAWMHTHERPWGDPIQIRATSLGALAADAAGHGQQLKMPESEYIIRLFGN
jgi:hypothetical protein